LEKWIRNEYGNLGVRLFHKHFHFSENNPHIKYEDIEEKFNEFIITRIKED
jgi:hypothetical protein